MLLFLLVNLFFNMSPRNFCFYPSYAINSPPVVFNVWLTAQRL